MSDLARLPYSDKLRIARMVEEGIPARVIVNLAQALGLTLPAMAKIMSIPTRTLERRIAKNARLSRTESELLVRLGRIYTKAIGVFEHPKAAARWLGEPCDALGGRAPLDLSRTELGSRNVEQLLGRIEHGVF